MQENPAFHFVPYRFGCFSFQSYADKRALIYYKVLSNGASWHKIDKENYVRQLNHSDEERIMKLRSQFANFTQSDLISYVYTNFPYFALNSTIKNKYLKLEDDLKKIDDRRVLYTVGYEGCSIDKYLDKLVKESIKVVCDVRKNPISMKYGFSKNQLSSLLQRLGIQYVHIPELGIESNKRKHLKSETDYAKLFNEYEADTLCKNVSALTKVLGLLEEYKKIALTCFEETPNRCHRGTITNYFQSKLSFENEIVHL